MVAEDIVVSTKTEDSFLFTVFFFNDTATSEIYTLSLHDALPIFDRAEAEAAFGGYAADSREGNVASARDLVDRAALATLDRKSTRLNSSHVKISYAVFCLKKKKKLQIRVITTQKDNYRTHICTRT